MSSIPRAHPSPSETPGLLPLLGWLTGAVFFLYAWVLRVAPSVMVEELMRDLAVGGAVLGHLSGVYYYGYAGMQVPVGALLDQFGPRRLMTGAGLVCAAGCVLFATGATLAGVTVGRFLVGASAAFSLVGAMAVARRWFPANRFAVLPGWAMAMGAHPKYIQAQLGHASIQTTLDRYGHLMPEMHAAETRKLDRLVFGTLAGPGETTSASSADTP